MEKVKIPLKYKKNLERRFDEKNAVLSRNNFYFSIRIPCAICKSFLSNCDKCFFSKVNTTCIKFIYDIIPEYDGTLLYISEKEIGWSYSDDKEARELLRKIREKGEEMIEFVG